MEEMVVRLGYVLTSVKQGQRVPIEMTDGLIYVPGESIQDARATAIGLVKSRYTIPEEAMLWPINTHPASEQQIEILAGKELTYSGRITGFEGLVAKI